MSVHEEYIDLVKRRYGTLRENSYEDNANYLALLYGPEQYLVEKEMLEFMKANPDVTSRECCFHFDDVAPDGLAPGDDGSGLLDDD